MCVVCVCGGGGGGGGSRQITDKKTKTTGCYENSLKMENVPA